MLRKFTLHLFHENKICENVCKINYPWGWKSKSNLYQFKENLKDTKNFILDQNYEQKFNESEFLENSVMAYNLIYKTYFACLRVVLVWGVGTALGEAPPYFIAYTYDISNKKEASKLYKMFGDNEQRIRGYIDKTVYYLKKHSFTTILLLSAWPNALFDLCGVSAGLVKLSFAQFIIPTIIGKAFIKNVLGNSDSF